MNREFQQIYDLLTLANGRDSSEPAGASALSKKVLLNTATALLVGVGYYMGTVVGFALTPKGQPNSTFWPPNAILLAAFLLAPQRMWWAFLGAVFPAHMLVQLRVGVPIWTAVGWFITNTSEAFIGAFFISQFTRRKEVFETVRGVFMFVMFGVLMAPFATSFLDAAAVVITGWGHGCRSRQNDFGPMRSPN